MEPSASDQVLHHEIFGSILDRAEMTPFLLLPALEYGTAVKQATKMMANRGFDTHGGTELPHGERARASRYIRRAFDYFFEILFPFVTKQLEGLTALRSPNEMLYRRLFQAVNAIAAILKDPELRRVVDDDPRHLFLLASSKRYPRVFRGYAGVPGDIPASWQQAACSLLKMCHLIKSIEEDSQDINDYAQLGFFLEKHGRKLNELDKFDWKQPDVIPDSEPAQRAFVKLSAFFHKLRESLEYKAASGSMIFNSGDGVEVEIAEIKARLKSPESMVTKLGKDVEGEAYDIRDILAITFILRNMDDTLKLFHALQKRGVILQENTASHSITQTLFNDPESMIEAVRRLTQSLSQSGGGGSLPDDETLLTHARMFYRSLSMNAEKNRHTSRGHRKFQCKIAFSLPIHRSLETNEILVPGTPLYAQRDRFPVRTEQHTLGVELRISDVESWRASEYKAESHHDAYKFRQLVYVMNRVFKSQFDFPGENIAQLRKDQAVLFL
jgi:uncharacterized protein (TIGR04562 family)